MQETQYANGRTLRKFFQGITEGEVRQKLAENAKKALLDADVRAVICRMVSPNDPCPCGSGVRFDLCHSPYKGKC